MKKEPICKNCLLYDFKKQHCSVFVLFEGQKINPPTSPEDHCLFDTEFRSLDSSGKTDVFIPEIQEVKIWKEEDKVKIQYPNGFFGKE